MKQQIKGGCIKNPEGVLRIAKNKDGHGQIQVTRRVQPILDVVKKVRANPLCVLRVAKKSSGERRAEKQKNDVEKLGYNGYKTFEEVEKSGKLAKPSKYDANNCLAVKGGGEE